MTSPQAAVPPSGRLERVYRKQRVLDSSVCCQPVSSYPCCSLQVILGCCSLGAGTVVIMLEAVGYALFGVTIPLITGNLIQG
jgi:hypothetical protein